MALSLFIALMTAATNNAAALEQPEYELLFKEGKIEYRLYQPFVVAETTVLDARSYGRGSNEGFMRLFRYITGANQSRTEIDMTAPVIREAAEARDGEEIAMTAPVQTTALDQGWRIAFMLPSQYSLQTAPIPSDQRIILREVPGRLMAVIRYSGRWTERNLEKFESRLRENISDAGLKVMGQAEAAAYNPPFTPPFMRRNEIMLEVSGIPQSAAISSPD